MFFSVLDRKDNADRTRNALMVLNRFKFLFHLPANIRSREVDWIFWKGKKLKVGLQTTIERNQLVNYSAKNTSSKYEDTLHIVELLPTK